MSSSHQRLQVTGTDRALLLNRLAAGLEREGATLGETLDLMREFNQTRCIPPLPAAEFAAIFNQSVLAAPNLSAAEVGQRGVGNERLDVADLSQLPREAVDWLWPGRIPLGKVSVLSGEADIGKSLLSFDIAARVTRGGDWPDATTESAGEATRSPGGVLLLNADDNLVDSAGPRLADAGAVMEHIVAIKGVRSGAAPTGSRRGMDLDRDLPALRTQLLSMPAIRLVIIDPITAYCGQISRYVTAKTRRMVTALSDLAAEFNVAILLITDHRNMGIPSRVSWVVQRDPFEGGLRVWAPHQFHYGSPPQSLGFRFGEGRIEWDSKPVKLTADALGTGSGAVRRTRVRMQVVATWLLRFLEPGPREATEVYAAGEAVGLSGSQLWRAKETINVEVLKLPQQFGKWLWQLKPRGSSPHVDEKERLVATPS